LDWIGLDFVFVSFSFGALIETRWERFSEGFFEGFFEGFSVVTSID